MWFTEGPDILSITAQELIAGPSNRISLLKGYATDTSGEDVSTIPAPPREQAIEEPKLRQYIDQDSNSLKIIGRQVDGIRKAKGQFKGITRDYYKRELSRTIEHALEQDIELCIPLAENSGVTKNTAEYIGDDSRIVNIRAVEGKRATHYVNELVTPTSYLALLNVLNARNKA